MFPMTVFIVFFCYAFRVSCFPSRGFMFSLIGFCDKDVDNSYRNAGHGMLMQLTVPHITCARRTPPEKEIRLDDGAVFQI